MMTNSTVMKHKCHTQFNFFVGAAVISSTRFDPGSGPILFSFVACVGSEHEILQCENATLQNSCISHNLDAGVSCQPGEIPDLVLGATYQLVVDKCMYVCCIRISIIVLVHAISIFEALHCNSKINILIFILTLHLFKIHKRNKQFGLKMLFLFTRG